MKLHLNKTLRAALIAAITAVGFSLPQAQATITVDGALSDWTTYTDVKVGGTDHAITAQNNSLTFNQGQTTSLLNWSIEYKYVWDSNTISGVGATISLNNNSTSANNHLSALVLSEESEYRLYIGYGTTDKKSEGYIVLSNTPGQVLTMSYAKDTDTLSITDQTSTISYVCGDYDEAETTLTSGNVRLFTNGGKDKMYVNSVSGQYIDETGGVKVSAGEWSKQYTTVTRGAISTAPVDATLVLTGRLQVNGGEQSNNLSANGGDIVVGNAGTLFLQTWGASAITLENDIYIGSSTNGDVGTWGVLRVGSDSKVTTLNGDIHLIENSSIGANQTGGQDVNFNGKVSGDYELIIKRGQKLHFKDMDVKKLIVNDLATPDFSGTVAIGELSISSNTQVTLKEGGTLTVNGLSGAGTLNAGVATIDVAEGGDYTFSGTVNGSIVKLGTGSQTIGDGILTHTIQTQKGTLVLSGTYEIKDIAEGEHETIYVDANDEESFNGGFMKNTGFLRVYTVNTEAGAQLDLGNAVFTYDGEVVTEDVRDGAYTLPSAPVLSTVYVKNGSLAIAAFKAKAGEALTTVSLANDTTIVMDEAASINLVMESGANATVNATAATTISSITGWSDNTLTITGTGSVTMPNQDLTLVGSTALVIGTNVTSKKIQLNSDTARLEVKAGAALTTSGDTNLTVVKGVADIYGTVNVSHEVDLSSSNNSTGKLHIYNGGSVIVEDGMWMSSNGAAVLLEEGGTYAIIGKGVKFLGKAGVQGSITAQNAQVNYSTNDTNALIRNITMEALGNITIANQLTNVDVVTGAHSVTLNTDADSVTVSNGGTFTLNEGKKVDNITVENGGTIASGVDATQVGIVAHGTATFNEGVIDETAGIYIAGDDTGATVTNHGDTIAKYAGLQDSTMTVAAEGLYSMAESGAVVNNDLQVDTITHVGTGTLTLTQVDAQVLDGVYSYGGPLTLQSITEVTLSNMAIGADSTVAVYTDGQASSEGKVTIAETLSAGGGTLLANLEMADGSTLDLSLMDGGMQALTLGSEFTIADGSLVTLDDATLAAIAGLENIGDKVILIKQYGDHELTTNLTDGDWARTHFDLSSIAGADYQLYVGETEIGLMKSSNVPEPTTGTLSLLALMALAARRRRK